MKNISPFDEGNDCDMLTQLRRIADALEKIASTEYTKISIGDKSVTRSVLRDIVDTLDRATKAYAAR